METEPEFNDWLQQAQAGSTDALGQALEACRNYLLMVAERELDVSLRAKGGASDIVQETFIEAQRTFPRFSSDSQEAFQAWLRAMLLNNLADFRRRYRGTQKRSADRERSLEGGASSVDWRGSLAAETRTPSGEFVHQETLDGVDSALRRLPEDYQRVVTLRYMDNCSFDQIAEKMGRSANAIRKLFARAIERLQLEMERAP